jgi:serine protease AprX
MAAHRARRALFVIESALVATAVAVPLAALPPTAATVRPAAQLLHPLDIEWGDDTTGEGARSTLIAGHWVPQHDHGSMWYVTKQTGAQDVWGKSDPRNGDRKLTGHGVGVALIDTGIAPVEGLAIRGKVVNGPDLSFESRTANTRFLDGYGHGTHMAGILAGRDSAVAAGNENDDKYFVGMAPDAKLVNVKVGVADGAADVSQIIAAIDWVVQHRGDHNIRVLNLSYGTDSSQRSTIDPLAHAVENAWRAGIVVVAAAGNDGEGGTTRLTMPAVDPYVIAVGSSDHHGSDKPEDATVGAWTNDGTSARRPDLLAPGKSVVSLRVPGSLVDRMHPEGLIDGDPTDRMFRGTGTSQSAAVVSGAAALLLQRNPELTPDHVKGLLRASADPLMRDRDLTQGAGLLDVKGAVELLERGRTAAYRQSWAASTGTGSLEAARGGSHVADPDNGAVLSGEHDVFGVAWDPETWAAASAQRRSWSGGTWRGSEWAGTGWSGSSWSPGDWTRRSWSGVDWSRRSWSTMSFLRRSWSGDDWCRRSWSADNFSRRSWSTGNWVLSDIW